MPAKFTANPYLQAIFPDDKDEMLARLRLDSTIPSMVVDKTTPNSIYGGIRRTAFDVGNAANEVRAAAGAQLNKYVSTPLREAALSKALSPDEVQDYYRKRYVALPSTVMGTRVGTAFIPGIGGVVNKYIDKNIEYVEDHGFDKYLSEKGVNLGNLKIAEGFNAIGDNLKKTSLEIGESPDTLIDLGHKVMRRGAVGAVGLGVGGYALGKSIHRPDGGDFSFMSQNIRLFKVGWDEEGAEAGRAYAVKAKPVAKAVAGGAGAGIGLVGTETALSLAPKESGLDGLRLLGGIGGAWGGRYVGTTAADKTIDRYYELKGGLGGVDAIPSGTDDAVRTIRRISPKGLLTTGGLAAVGAAGLGYGAGAIGPDAYGY